MDFLLPETSAGYAKLGPQACQFGIGDLWSFWGQRKKMLCDSLNLAGLNQVQSCMISYVDRCTFEMQIHPWTVRFC